MINKNLQTIKDGVNISFSGEVKKSDIVKMVQNCSTGQCECMSNETKSKIKDMKVDGIDGEVTLTLKGDITQDEIATALQKSKVVN
jgi:ABC-type transporter Mla MlaB component